MGGSCFSEGWVLAAVHHDLLSLHLGGCGSVGLRDQGDTVCAQGTTGYRVQRTRDYRRRDCNQLLPARVAQNVRKYRGRRDRRSVRTQVCIRNTAISVRLCAQGTTDYRLYDAISYCLHEREASRMRTKSSQTQRPEINRRRVTRDYKRQATISYRIQLQNTR